MDIEDEVVSAAGPTLSLASAARRSPLRVGLRGMRVVLSLLTAEVASVPVGVTILPLKTLLARPCFDQRAVHGDMFVRHQGRRPLHDAAKEAAPIS
jgi:hypothetical protein